MLLPRVLTAVLGIPFILYMIHAGGIPFLVFAAGLAALSLYEFGLILWLGGRGVQRLLIIVGGSAVCLGVSLSSPAALAGPGLAHLAVTGLLIAAVLREMFRAEHSLDRAALTLFGALFIGWTLGHLVLIRQIPGRGEALTFLLFAGVWATDTCAYAAGHAFGARKMAAVLSPKKTWEGAAGGFLGALGTALLLRRLFLADALGVPAALALGALIGTAGQISDVAQSMVKRAAGAKDSSSLLPGHGGVFDRVDSFLLLAPAVYWLLALLSVGSKA